MGDPRVRVVIRVVGLAALLGILVTILLGGDAPLPVGADAPRVAVRFLDGREATLVPVGDTPLVVNVWATWCAPCLQELPDFVAAAEAYAGRVRFIGLAIESAPADVARVVSLRHIPYDIAMMSDPGAHAWNATALPSTYILDASGKVRWSMRGATSRSVLDAQLAPLLAAP